METTTTVKSEGIPPEQRIIMDEEPENPRNIKSVKRRRRDAAAVPPFDKVAEGGGQQQPPPKDQQPATISTSTSTVKRSSKFRGVNKHRWTGRFEAHLWDKGSWNPTQRKKGKQVYLGAYDEEESAARAYDLTAIKYWGSDTFTNFPATDYEEEIEMMQTITKEEYLASLRRRSNGFSRGMSKYRGVAKHHHNGRWEARIGRVFGNKYLYLGTYSTQEEAAHAYDIAAIEYRGVNAVTNFDLSTYIRWLRPGVGGGLNALAATSQDPRSNLEPKPERASSSSIIQDRNKQSDFSFSTDLPVPNKVDDSNNKQAFLQRTMSMSSSCNSSSSPTALGLLLRSSIFRDLVEKNSHAANEEELDDGNTKNKQVEMGIGDQFGAVFADEARYVYHSSAEVLPTGFQDGASSPLYNQNNGQSSLWDSAFALSSSTRYLRGMDAR